MEKVPLPYFTQQKKTFCVNTMVCIYVIWFTNCSGLSYLYHVMKPLDESKINTVAQHSQIVIVVKL